MMKPVVAVCLVLSLAGCLKRGGELSEQSFQTTTSYSDNWVTVSGTDPRGKNDAGAADPNKIPVGGENGNREFLFADSIKQENGVITALVEYRYAAPQVLPETGRSYTHNHWLEQIDCANGIRSIRATTHYNADGQIVDANEYAVPRYSAEDIKMLSKPDDPVIVEACRRVNGAPPPAAASEAASGTEIAHPPFPAASEPAVPPETAASAPKATENAASEAASVPALPESASAPAATASRPEPAKESKDGKKGKEKGKRGKRKTEETAKPADPPAAASVPAAAPETPAAPPPAPADNGEIPLTPVSTAP